MIRLTRYTRVQNENLPPFPQIKPGILSRLMKLTKIQGNAIIVCWLVVTILMIGLFITSFITGRDLLDHNYRFLSALIYFKPVISLQTLAIDHL